MSAQPTSQFASTRKRLLIVDGYNVIRSGSRYRHIELPDYTDEYYNYARDFLLNDVINFAGRKMDAIIVYDGAYKHGSSSRTESYGRVKVMFSARGQSADTLIERLAHDARGRGVETLVVTSDATIQDTVFGEGATRMSAEGFCIEMEGYNILAKEDTDISVSKKNTVADRISAETLAKLIALRDDA